MEETGLSKKLLGVIGGMGAQASADFYNIIIQNTHYLTDQDHIEMLIYNKASIPDRTSAIKSGQDAEVTHSLQEAYNRLADAGADYVVMACNTAHYFIDKLDLRPSSQFVNMLDETVDYLKNKGFKKVGLMATEGTIQSKVYKNKLSANQIETVVPSEKNQKLLMEFIYKQIKAGKKPDDEIFNLVSQELMSQNVQAIIIGCTELSYYANLKKLSPFYIDPQRILARKCIVLCGGEVTEEEYD